MMDLDDGINLARNGRWSKWWAEARLLVDAPGPASSENDEVRPPAPPGSALAQEATGGYLADEFFALLSRSRAYVLLLDLSYKILATSQSFRNSLIVENNPVGSNFIDLLDPGSQFKARSLLEKLTARSCQSELEVIHRTRADTAHRVNYCFCRRPDFGLSGIIAVGRDQENPLELIEQLVQLNTELEQSRHVPATDELTVASTGLGNRRSLDERLNALWSEAECQGTLVWVMMADVDEFKKFNHTFGHDSGDELLKEITQVLHKSLRAGDWVCRYEGDRFLLAGFCSNESEMPGLAGRILTAIRGLRFEVAGTTPRITISLGAALAHPIESCQPWVVLQAADRALHRAKDAGRDRYDVEAGVLGRPEGYCAKPSTRFR
jgi:diguanylate cyclase (GGDEF)-like protein